MSPDTGSREPLSPAELERLEELRSTTTLAELVDRTGADSVHDAYFAAKAEWSALRDRELPPATPSASLPGAEVRVGETRYVVHGVTHADTDAERSFLRDHVARYLDDGDEVYCEQGIRPMYFADLEAVCAMDDYRWALSLAEERRQASGGGASSLPEAAVPEFERVVDDVESLATQFREAAFSLVHAGEDVYGEAFASALGDVASSFLTGIEDVATGRDFEAFAKSRRAAEDPTRLGALQRYYETAFLPQPLEREWLRCHDPELEGVSHARNERLADYAVYHSDDDAEVVRLVVGAAHQPGVRYYLERHRDGHRDVEGFELVE